MSIAESPDLKFRFLWLIIGYVLVAVVTFLSLTSDPIDTGLQFPHGLHRFIMEKISVI
jgi:hypothetical protein